MTDGEGMELPKLQQLRVQANADQIDAMIEGNRALIRSLVDDKHPERWSPGVVSIAAKLMNWLYIQWEAERFLKEHRRRENDDRA